MAEAAAIYILIGMVGLAFALARSPQSIETFAGRPMAFRVAVVTAGSVVWVIFWLPCMMQFFWNSGRARNG